MRSASQPPASLLDEFRSAGRRITASRRAIGTVVAQSTDHPHVEEIHRRARDLEAGISLATVYRTLNLFADMGLIDLLSFEGGRVRIEGAHSKHHDHLIDVTTGAIFEFRSEEIERLQAEVASRLGFALTGHRLELYGRPLTGAAKRKKASRASVTD